MANLEDYPAMLPYAEIEAAAAKLNYRRPGWSLAVFMDPWEGPKLRVVAKVPDGYNPDETVDLGFSARIPSLVRTTADFYEWVLWRLDEAESHETREYFWVEGAPFRDPHDPLEPNG